MLGKILKDMRRIKKKLKVAWSRARVIGRGEEKERERARSLRIKIRSVHQHLYT